MASDHITSIDFIDHSAVRQEAVADLIERLTVTSVDTRSALAAFVPDGDQYQKAVIEFRGPSEHGRGQSKARTPENDGRTVRLLAPAGSGKTQTIINRVLSLVKDGLKPSRILVLTFDNSAVTALKDRADIQLAQLQGSSGEGLARELAISTLNAYGFRLLKARFPNEARSIISEGRRHRFARDQLDALRDKSPQHHAALAPFLRTGVYLDYFGLLKNELFDPRQVDARAISDFIAAAKQSQPLLAGAKEETAVRAIQAIVWLFQTYDSRLVENGLMDFDDQKLRAFVELGQNVDVLEAVQGSYDEVIVDEFQDINRLDFELIRQIAADASLVVTGDDDQAIYGFRGCSPDYIINLEDRLGRPVTSFELRVNYRCPANIVGHADRLIRHNTFRVAKDPIADRTDAALIKVVGTQTAGVEARGTVTFIDRVMKAQPGLAHSDFAVLYRTNAQSLPLQVEFVLNDVPYFVRTADNILENEALGRLLALLRLKLAVAAHRQPAIEDQVMALGSYFRYWSPAQQAAAREILSSQGGFYSSLRSSELISAIPKTNGRVADAFDALFGTRSLQQTLEVIAQRFHGVRGMVGSLEDALTEQVPLGEVFELAAHFGGSLEDFLEKMESALARARAAKAGKVEDGVQLLTYFKSKGRQWHTVILTTCNEGLIPHSRAHSGADLEDERRLFYVAMTRASSNLMISYLGTAVGKKVAPSRFLSEAGLL